MIEEPKAVVFLIAVEAIGVQNVFRLVHHLEAMRLLRNGVWPMIARGLHDRKEWLCLGPEDVVRGEQQIII